MGLSVLLAVQVAPPGGILRLLSVSVEQPAPLDELDADELPDDVDSQSLLLLPVAGDVALLLPPPLEYDVSSCERKPSLRVPPKITNSTLYN